jgi:hypothetical protein
MNPTSPATEAYNMKLEAPRRRGRPRRRVRPRRRWIGRVTDAIGIRFHSITASRKCIVQKPIRKH